MHRSIPTVVTATFILIATIVSARGAGPRYAVTQLRPLVLAAGTYASLSDINDHGVVIGEQATFVTQPNGSRQFDYRKWSALIWSPDGTATSLAVPRASAGAAEYVGASASRINNAGQAIGHVYQSGTGGIPTYALWSDPSSPSLLRNAQAIAPTAINDSGVIVGHHNGRPVVLRNGVVSQLNTGSFSNGWATDINNDGTIVGTLYSTNNYANRPHILSSSAAPVAMIPTSVPEGNVAAINAHGVAVGDVRDANYVFDATRYVGAQRQSLGKLPSSDPKNSSRALFVNDRGDAVGVSGLPTASAYDTKAVLWRDGQIIDLRLATDGPLPLGFRVAGINNRGQIIGNAFTDHDGSPTTPWQNVAVRLDPIRTAGDTNYDNAVDFSDLLTLAQNYGKTGNGNVFWESGDFNFDWAVNFDDLLTLAQHYAAPASFAGDWALAQSLVPEPTLLASLVPVSAIALARRRRLA